MPSYNKGGLLVNVEGVAAFVTVGGGVWHLADAHAIEHDPENSLEIPHEQPSLA
jgi:hypothetical protein